MTRAEARQFIIDHCCPNYENPDNTQWDTAMVMAIEALQERKTGMWISQWFKGIQFHVCSECRKEFSYDNETGVSMDIYDYCPNCGAKMEVDE